MILVFVSGHLVSNQAGQSVCPMVLVSALNALQDLFKNKNQHHKSIPYSIIFNSRPIPAL